MRQQPSVTFYPLKQIDPDSVFLFACRLVEKARQLDHRIHLQSTTPEQAKRLDELLWQFKSESFLPHVNIDEIQKASANNVKITLGSGVNIPANPEVLICLTDKVWDLHSEFKDIREIVAADDTGREYGRQRYRYYQNQGYSIETLKL